MNVESLNLTTSQGATTAYVARPEKDVAAGVLLIQEYWGINEHIRDLAGRFASEGYLCVAPDLYRGRIAADKDEAAALMQALPIEDGMETIRKALDAVKETYRIEAVRYHRILHGRNLCFACCLRNAGTQSCGAILRRHS